ncbi:hypothetical protein ACS0TY_012960 [Phlomoides rotata]
MDPLRRGVGISLEYFIGIFLEYDASNRDVSWKPYMRIRVELDVDLPLKRWKRVKLANGVATQVDFKYEILHTFCFICGKLGHSKHFCEVLYSSGQTKIPKGWGTFLKAPDRRSYGVGENRWLKTEGGAIVTNFPSLNMGVIATTNVKDGLNSELVNRPLVLVNHCYEEEDDVANDSKDSKKR